MSEPIKVTREQWDAAFYALCDNTDTTTEERQAAMRSIFGPRPAPDPPTDLCDEEGMTIAYASIGHAEILEVAHPLVLPWVRDHLLPWLEAQTEEAADA